MSQDSVTVDQVHLEKVFPALRILVAVRLAFSVQVLVPAILAMLLLNFVSGIGRVRQSDPPASTDSAEIGTLPSALLATTSETLAARDHWFLSLILDLDQVIRWRTDIPGSPFFRVLLQVLIHSGFAAAICCAAAREFCLQQRTGVINSLRRSRDTARFWAVSPCIAAGLVLIPWFSLQVLKWLFSAIGITAFFPGLTLMLLTSLALLCTLILIALSYGWLLSLPAIGADFCPGPEGLSRGISYVLSHPRLASIYAVTLLFSCVFSGAVVRGLSQYAVSMTGYDEISGLNSVSGRWDIASFAGDSFELAVFYCGMTVIYLLLRQREDAVELTELVDGFFPLHSVP
jgi:hypothetical protein